MATLDAEFEGGWLHLTLNNLKHGNSFGLNESELLQSYLDSYENDHLKGILMSSAEGRLFCSGGNLTFYGALNSRGPGIRANRKIRRALKRLSQISVPTICVVDGDCFGGGVELISAFDRVISAPQSFFGFWQRRIGLTFGWGGAERLSRRLPYHQLQLMALEARSIGAYEAQSLHLIDEIAPSYQLIQTAKRWLVQAGQWPVSPVPGIKQVGQRDEVKVFEKLWLNDEHRAVLHKFTQKKS